MRKLLPLCAVAMVVLGCSSPTPKDQAEAAKPKFGTWGVETADMDPTVRPGNDFFDYAVGSWAKSLKISDDEQCAGVNVDVDDNIKRNVQAIVETAGDERDDKPAQQISDLYAAYMDEATIDKRGIEPVRKYLTAIDGATDRPGLDAALVNVTGDSSLVFGPFDLYRDIDPNTPNRYLPVYWQGGLSMNDRAYYLDQDPDTVDIRKQFVAHAQRLLGLAGYTDSATQAKQILALETKLAEVQWPTEDTYDVTKTNAVMARREAEQLATGVPLAKLFDANGVPADADVQIAMPDVLQKTAAIFASEPVADWQAYLRYQVLSKYGNFLTKPIADEVFSFDEGVLLGTEARRPRAEEAVDFVSEQLGDAVGQRYVEKYFPERTKQQVSDMMTNFETAYATTIDHAAWMSEQTKAEAKAKLATLVTKVGYPEHWKSYDTAEINSDDLVGNADSLQAWLVHDDASKFGKPLDHLEWSTTAQTNNAFYYPQLNDITMTAGILQAPFFDPAADAAANYGATGATIGHEISHAFDSEGRKADSTGALRDWWTPADAERYESSAARLAAQFDQYEPLPGQHIDGTLTLTENIADLVGLEVAYDAYQLSLGGKKAPVIDGFTGDQRFFIAYAASWKELCRDESVRDDLKSNPHSPPEYRVNGIVRNMDEWYTAFDVKEGDALYLAPKDRVKMW